MQVFDILSEELGFSCIALTVGADNTAPAHKSVSVHTIEDADAVIASISVAEDGLSPRAREPSNDDAPAKRSAASSDSGSGTADGSPQQAAQREAAAPPPASAFLSLDAQLLAAATASLAVDNPWGDSGVRLGDRSDDCSDGYGSGDSEEEWDDDEPAPLAPRGPVGQPALTPIAEAAGQEYAAQHSYAPEAAPPAVDGDATLNDSARRSSAENGLEQYPEVQADDCGDAAGGGLVVKLQLQWHQSMTEPQLPPPPSPLALLVPPPASVRPLRAGRAGSAGTASPSRVPPSSRVLSPARTAARSSRGSVSSAAARPSSALGHTSPALFNGSPAVASPDASVRSGDEAGSSDHRIFKGNKAAAGKRPASGGGWR